MLNMNKLFFSSFLLFFPFFFTISTVNSVASNASCPIDLSYVGTVPWDTWLCRKPENEVHCCQSLLSLFGVGIAQNLKQTSMFQLPDEATSSACLLDFQTRIASLSINPLLVTSCFRSPTQFVTNSSSCVGIASLEDWKRKLGPMSSLDTACKGDLSDLTQCSLCSDAGLVVTSLLTSMDPKRATKCFYFTCLYAASINEFGPMNPRTAACALALPLDSDGKENASHNVKPKFVFAFLGGFIGVVLVLGLVIAYWRIKRKKEHDASHEHYVSTFKSSVLPKSGAKWFGFRELEQATNGFSQQNYIGQGGSGAIYKGTLEDGTLVVVKQIHEVGHQSSDEEFSNEVEIISKIRHRNLLSLRGCCVTSDNWNGKRRYLVYDYMSNGSLGDHLCRDDYKNQLTWPKRKNIILDVATGLSYLHTGIKPAIYHRDIKSTNILLDKEMRAKVADFGLAKQNLEGQSHLTTRVAGTHGYLAPEYALYGQLTEKSDVYSFGILILEVMSGRKVIDTMNPSSFLLITDWAWTIAKSGRVEQVFDECIRDQGPKGIMERYVQVGLLCAHVMVAFRPTIVDALRMLEGDIDIPTLPDRPLPLGHESFRSSLWQSSSYSTSNRSKQKLAIQASI